MTYLLLLAPVVQAACGGDSTEPNAVTETTPVLSDLTAGYFHTCALDLDGRAYCWGDNREGQLGTGDTITAHTPRPVADAHEFVQIRAGEEHTCALDATGAAYCWGSNQLQQLGDAGASDEKSTVPVGVSGGHQFTEIAAGRQHTCGLDASGAAWCWGSDIDGQSGDSTWGGTNGTPVAVFGGHDFAHVVSGYYHSCGLEDDGAAFCWGANYEGQLGTGGSAGSLIPTGVTGGHALASIVAGHHHTCGIESDGSAYCWGWNQLGALGDSSQTLRREPVSVVRERYERLAGGGLHTCGITTAGDAYCWGRDSEGQLGTGQAFALGAVLVPTPVSGDIDFVQLALGYRHTCGLDDTGTVFCWGSSYVGQLGVGAATEESATPLPIAPLPLS